MANPAPTILNAIDSLFITLYDRVADYSDYQGFSSLFGLSVTQAASTTATVAQFQTIAAAMTSPSLPPADLAYYNTNYGSLNNVQFIEQLFSNLGGPTNQSGISGGVVYYSGELNSGDSRSFVLGQFVHDFLTFNTTGDAAATARQQTLWNKVQVSEAYALASQTNPFLVSTAPGQPAFAAEIAIVANVTSDHRHDQWRHHQCQSWQWRRPRDDDRNGGQCHRPRQWRGRHG
ncbi:MAG: hypothetical protein WB816_10355 [Methylocystis sp.]